VASDALYPPVQQLALHGDLLSAGASSTWFDIDSPHGHDGFLIETGQLAPRLTQFLEETA
jgi:homoserine O-acetyltransferase